MLYLTDTAANQGGFRCIPGFHKVFPEWRKAQPADQEMQTRRYAYEERMPIANPQGDPRGREKRQPQAELTELGQRLIGFRPWD